MVWRAGVTRLTKEPGLEALLGSALTLRSDQDKDAILT